MNQYRDLSDDELMGLYRSEQQQLGAVSPAEPKSQDRLNQGIPIPPPKAPAPMPSPDGSTIKDGFDGLSDEDLMDIYKKKGGDPAKLQATQDAATGLDYAQGTTGGINRGIAAALGAPVDLMSAAIEFVGVPQPGEPVLGSQWFKDVFSKMEDLAGVTPGSMTSKGPDTPAGRILTRVGEEIGAGMVPGGLAAKGPKIAQAAIPKGGIKELVRNVFTNTAGKPVAGILAAETAALTGAGAGAGLAREIAPDSMAGEIIGQLFGGTAAAFAPSVVSAKLGSRLMSKFSPEAQRQVATETASKFIQGDMTTEALERLDDSARLIDEIPGFKPTTAERAGTPGLLEAQKQLEKRATPAAVKRRQTSEAAIGRYAGAKAPKAENDLEYVVDTARQQVDDVRGDLARDIDDVAERQVRLAERHAPPGDPLDAGTRIRQALEGRYGEEQQLFTQYADEAGLNDEAFSIEFDEMRDALKDAYESASKFVAEEGEALAPPSQAVSRILKGDDVQSLPALLEIRSDIARELRLLETQGTPDSKALRGLRVMKKAFDDQLEEAIEQSGDPEMIDRFRDFNQRYRNDIVELFKDGPSRQVLRKTGAGTYVTPDEKVAEAYFRPGHVSAANQFNKVFKDDPMARAALRDTVLDSLNKAVVRDGRIKPEALQNWMGRHRTVLDEFPGIRDEISNTVELQDDLVRRAKELDDRQKMVQKRLLTRRVDSFTRGTIQPDRLLDDAVQKPQLMRELVESVKGSPEALAGLRRAVWDKVEVMEPGSIADYLDKHAGSLDQVLSPKHRESLRIIDGARSLLAQTPTPTPDVSVPTIRSSFINKFGIAPDMLANRIHTLNTGRSEKSYVVTNVLFNIFGRKQQEVLDDVMRKVLYEPQVAADLAQSIKTGQVSGPVAQRLGARWFALGITPISGLAEDGDEQ